VPDELGMGPGTQRLLVGHMGCYAAIPGLGALSDYVMARRRPALLLCLELPSLHVQPPSGGLEQVVAHALFSDGASALVVEPGPIPAADVGGGGSGVGSSTDAVRHAGSGLGSGLAVVDVAARTDASTADHMTWDITDLGFRMGLSRRVPDVLARHVGPSSAATGWCRTTWGTGLSIPAVRGSSRWWPSSSPCRPVRWTRPGSCWLPTATARRPRSSSS
jgi:alkylresorcinol/alkylpyrone synthase